MEIKIKIPTFFAEYRVVKIGDTYYPQKKDGLWVWRWVDEDGYLWVEDYKRHSKKCKSLEEAMAFIESQKQTVVWSCR